jgi:hypothetical protein
MPPVKYWEIIADKLSAAGWTWGYRSTVTQQGWRWIVDAHKNDGERYIVDTAGRKKKPMTCSLVPATRSVA